MRKHGKTKKCTVAIPLQQLLREHATMLRYTHTVHTTLTANGQAACFLCRTVWNAGYYLHEFWPSKCEFLLKRIFFSSITLDHLTSPLSSLNLSFLQHASLIYLSSTPWFVKFKERHVSAQEGTTAHSTRRLITS